MAVVEADPVYFAPPLELVETGSPLAEAIADRMQGRINTARIVIGMVNGENSRANVADILTERGLYKTKDSSAASTNVILDDINEIALAQAGRPLILKDKRKGPYSADPILADDFMALRGLLLPVVRGGNPADFMTEQRAAEYETIHQADEEKTASFIPIMERANFDLSVPIEQRHRREASGFNVSLPIPNSSRSALLENVLAAAADRPGDSKWIPATPREILKTGVHANINPQVKVNLVEKVQGWFGEQIFSYADPRYSSSTTGPINGINRAFVSVMNARLVEVAQLNERPELTIADRQSFWSASDAVNDFLAKRTREMPYPGQFDVKAALCIYTALGRYMDEHERTPLAGQISALRDNYHTYLTFLGILTQGTLKNKDPFRESRHSVVTKNLSEAACKGAGLKLFVVECREEAKEALEICKGCKVREPCLEEGLQNHLPGVWGGEWLNGFGLPKRNRGRPKANDTD